MGRRLRTPHGTQDRMIKYIKEYRFYLILFFFLLIPIISIDTATRAPRDYRFYDRFFSGLTYPIQAGITWTLDTLISFFQNYIYMVHVRKDNAELTLENQRLQNVVSSLRETAQENDRLRNLLAFNETHKIKTVVSRVIAADVSTDFRMVRLNRGSASGIKEDMAVVSNEGIVGRVLRVNQDTSDVVTILDPLSAVDAMVKRSRVRGIVEGASDETCRLKYALRTDDIQVDDLLITSGLGGVFPKGIAVGIVTQVNRERFGITQSVEVKPSVNFAKLEEVLVITQAPNAPAHLNEEL